MKTETAELARNEQKESINLIVGRVIREYPELAGIVISHETSGIDGYSGGEFEVRDNGEPPVVHIVEGFSNVVELLRKNRPTALGIMAEQLGKSKEELTDEIIQNFILLHELGHARDYISNYQNDSTIRDEYADNDPAGVWHMNYLLGLEGLPIPGMDPTDLRQFLDAEGKDGLLKEFPSLKDDSDRLGQDFIDQILERQERAYRALPNEEYADNFAVTWIKKLESEK